MTDFHSLAWDQLEPLIQKAVTSSATNARIPALQRVGQLLATNEIPHEALLKLSALVLQTYSFYLDDESRKEVVSTIESLLAACPALLDKYVKFIKDIAIPPKSIAVTDLITLLTWINRISPIAPELTADIVVTQAFLLESVVAAVTSSLATSNSKEKHNRRVYESVLTATRLSMYKTIKEAENVEKTIDTYVKALTSSSSSSASLLLLGLLAKTVHELAPVQPTAAQIFADQQKNAIVLYFSKDVLLGKTAPFPHALTVFGLFISDYITTKADFANDILPSLEKANLRSPEMTFGSILAPFFSNLPQSVSLGDIVVESKLLAQFISSLKSTKEETRNGALASFQVVLERHTFSVESTKTLISEIFKALKTISNVDQKVLFGAIIGHINPLAVENSESIISQLLTYVAKDQNEVSLTGYASAFVGQLKTALSFDLDLKDHQKFVNQLNTGLKEKKLNLRKVWATELGNLLQQTSVANSKITDLITQLSESLTASIDDAQLSPLPTVSNKGIAVPYVALSLLADPKLYEPLISIDGDKPSIISSHRVYTKLTGDECLWYLLALNKVPIQLYNVEIAQAWIYYAISKNVEAPLRRKTLSLMLELMKEETRETFASHIVDGLYSVLACKESSQNYNFGPAYISNVLNEISTVENVKDLLIISNYPGVNLKNGWTGLCQHLEVDAGIIILENHESIIDRCLGVSQSSPLYSASIKTLALCAFIQPDLVSPKLTKRVINLDISSLTTIDHSHITIWQGQDGELVNDPLAKKDKQIDRNTRDYETKKWEQDMRKELELKGKAAPKKKYTREEQQLINEELSKETEIRSQIQANVDAFLRSIDLIDELTASAAQNIDNGAKHWYPYAIDHVLEMAIHIDVTFLGDKPSKTLLTLSDMLSSRLGSIKKSIGAAILRVYKISSIPENYLQEPLIDLLSRILYFIKILSDKSPLDSLSLSYVLPLLKKVIENGKKVAIKNASKQAVTSEYADEDPEEEQLLLAMEIIGSHAEAFEDEFIPRTYILQELISLMKLASRAKLAKECFTAICQHISINIEESDLQLLFSNTIVSEVFVRTAVLEVLDSEFDLLEREVFTPELWIAVHDNDDQCRELATTIWSENEFEIPETGFLEEMLRFFNNSYPGLRYSIAKAAVEGITSSISEAVTILIDHFWTMEKPPAPIYDQFGLIVKTSQEQKDKWEDRSTVALVIKELTPHLTESSVIVQIFNFLVKDKALGDKEEVVRQELQEAGIEIIEKHGANTISELIPIFEEGLASKDNKSITESVVILYGALARHLNETDDRLEIIVERLLKTLDNSSEVVQYSISECIAPLVPKFEKAKLTSYFDNLFTKLFDGPKLVIRRGAAYGIAGLVKGSGIQALSNFDILRTLTDAAEDKKNPQRREGVSLAFYTLSRLLGKFFEPYVIEVLPIILKSLGDQVPEVRDATDLAARQIMKTTTSYGVKQLIPLAIANLDEIQWRSKKGSVELLGSMAYLDPTQLSASLSTIVPEIVGVLNDTHKEVRKAADQSLKRFGEVIRNPEIQTVVPNLLNAIGDPTKYTDDALDRLIKTQFVHYIDGPSLALIIHVIHRGMRDRSASTKRKACQIVGNMAILVDSGDLKPYLNQLVGELEVAMVDPVPGTRSTAARALGSLVEKLGEEQFPDLIPRLLDALQDETRAGDRLGSGQALAEVTCGLGINKLEELLPQILANATSSRPHIRAGFMPLLLFLPVCFGSQFAPYLSKIIPPILNGLADSGEEIRDTALRAGRLIVKNYAKKAVDLLLPELEIGLSDESYRIRLSSVELTGDLLFQVTGISGKNEISDDKEDGEEADEEENTLQSSEINKALTEALGQDRRDRILALLFICRSDVAAIVRSAAVDIWKALVSNTPRTVKEILPTLIHFIVLRLASPDVTQRTIAAQTLGDVVRRVGANALAQLLPTLEESMTSSSDNDAKQGICIALTELIRSSQHDALVEYQDVFIRTIRDALCDSAPGVRESAAQAFEALQEELGKVVIDEILPHLLNLLQQGDKGSVVESENALLALRDIMSTKSDIIFPILLPSLLSPPIDSFKATALASLASVAGPALYKRLSHVINTLVQAVIASESKGESEEQQQQIKDAFDSVLLAIDSEEGLHPLMQQLLTLVKHEDSAKRAVVYERLANFFSNTTLDYSVYTQDMIGQFILSLGDKASPKVVLGTFNALNALVKKQSKESLEKLVKPTRQALSLTGVRGEDLAGFALPRGPSCILPIFLHGLMYGNSEQKELSASGIAEIIEKTPAANLKPFATTITGPLIRVIGEKVNSDIKAAILQALTVLLAKIPQFLRPFIPQLQRTFVRSLSDPTNDKLRNKAVLALGTLIEFQPRVDSLVTELVSGAKNAEQAVKTSILKGILEVVSKAGKNMSEQSKTSIMTLVEEEITKVSEKSSVAYARLVGSLSKVMLSEEATNILKNKILNNVTSDLGDSKFSILSINSFLKDAPNHIFQTGLLEDIVDFVIKSSQSNQSYINDNATVAIGKILLLNHENKSPVTNNPVVSDTLFEIPPEIVEKLIDQLCQTMLQPSSNSPDSRRLSLVVIRTVARYKYDLEIKEYLDKLAPTVFTCIRDPIIPIRLAAEKCWLAIFQLVEDEKATIFDAWFNGKESMTNVLGASIQPRSIGDYTKRVAARLASVERERIEQGGDEETMFSDRFEDESEVWAVGGVELKK